MSNVVHVWQGEQEKGEEKKPEKEHSKWLAPIIEAEGIWHKIQKVFEKVAIRIERISFFESMFILLASFQAFLNIL